jgi:preprotein translocase subunit SecB
MTDKQEDKKIFSIQKLYIKDASFESPGSPQSFTFKQWDPKIELNLNNSNQHIDGNLYEAVLRVTVTAKQEENTAFLMEVHQAGLFGIAGFEEEEQRYLLGSQCMNVLFPYAREVISDMTVRGGFPPLLLSPVNFDGLYQQHLQQQKVQKDEKEQKEQKEQTTDEPVKH